MGRAKRIHPLKGPERDWRGDISRELKKAERLFVLGVGNRQRGDDAAGSLCVRLFKKGVAWRKRRAEALPLESVRPLRTLSNGASLELQVLDAGEAPESATGLIREFRPTHVLIVDAAVGGHQPGTIFIFDKEQIRQEEISTHRLPLFHLVRYLEKSLGCRVILVGIEPKGVAWGKPISAAVRAAAAHLAAWLGEILTAQRP